MNTYKRTLEILYMDGFDKKENHTLWKLKKRLTSDEWSAVKQFFKYYNHTDKNCSNCKYFGWMTTKPVQVLTALEGE